jgi:hypothetical protein
LISQPQTHLNPHSYIKYNHCPVENDASLAWNNSTPWRSMDAKYQHHHHLTTKLNLSSKPIWHVFWDITLCSPVKVNRRFGVTYRLHLQDRRVIQARNRIKLLYVFLIS